MVVYRISREEYATLTSSGVANRWNKSGEKVIYAGASRSLSTLELVVHRSGIKTTKVYKLIQIFFPDEPDLIEQIPISSLPKDWKNLVAYPVLQEIGSKWYNSKKSLILQVPSAIISQEFNFLINTTHPLFSKVKIIKIEDYFWDDRLL
jgi:RES domain-containing protein